MKRAALSHRVVQATTTLTAKRRFGRAHRATATLTWQTTTTHIQSALRSLIAVQERVTLTTKTKNENAQTVEQTLSAQKPCTRRQSANSKIRAGQQRITPTARRGSESAQRATHCSTKAATRTVQSCASTKIPAAKGNSTLTLIIQPEYAVIAILTRTRIRLCTSLQRAVRSRNVVLERVMLTTKTKSVNAQLVKQTLTSIQHRTK